MSTYKKVTTQIVSSKNVGMGSSYLKERKDLKDKNNQDTNKLKDELNQRELKSLEKKGLPTSTVNIEDDKDLVKLKNQLIKEDEEEKQENLKKRKGIDDDDTDSSDDDDNSDNSDNESNNKHRNKINKVGNNQDNEYNGNNSDNEDNGNQDNNEDDEDDSDDSDDDDSDDEEELMRELEKIKREKAEQQKKKEEEKQKELERERLERVAHGNPLLNNNSNSSGNYSTNKSWLDDGVFKNQARDEPTVKKRFINDTTRNDFAKKFLSKYIK